MVSGSYGTLSELEDGRNNSFNQRYHHQKDPNFKGSLKLGWVFILANIILETLFVTFDQLASTEEPEYGWISWKFSLGVMIVCIAELIYRGLIKEKLSLLQCLKSLIPCLKSDHKKPYSFDDGIVLAAAKVQMALSSISYGCLRQGKQSPISASFLSLAFIFCFVVYKFVKKQYCNPAILPLRQDS